MKNLKIFLDDKETILDFKEKTFSTGSRGYFAWGKVTDVEGKRFQVTMNIVEIGSRPKEVDKGGNK